ncbi:uncharacterized protein LOC129599782 [Paramacrobiotus metropolitanus]|uniref:uncharacterized protein LOC129599782 n=1 Tax=Paramacrobiotus metropolitanus TaxID=2943436 RepID=UPI0024457C4A|nr:uncharacterized protein LOC129599782 [Paramacrobiotus metropolitanus]
MRDTLVFLLIAALGTCRAQYEDDRRPPYEAEAGRGRHGHRSQHPEYVRVEVELLKMSNEGAIDHKNAYCDLNGNACDPVVLASLDTEHSFKEWPGPSDPAFWSEVFRVDNTNSPTLNKLLTKDSCGRPFRSAVARVIAEDLDHWDARTLINHWQCPVTKALVAGSRDAAQWSGPLPCISRYRPVEGKDVITLTFRYKAYQIAPGECQSNPTSTLRPGAVTMTTRTTRPPTSSRKTV